jgi:predicted nucleic acid-binding protein
MMSEQVTITAVLDANVLYPAPLRNYLLHLASLKVYYPLWTDLIQEEWIRSLLKSRPDMNRISLEARRQLMDKIFNQSRVTDYEPIIETLSIPDPNDRHVLAAAIKAKADVIVTANLKDFPDKVLARYKIRAEHPDDFVLACIYREKEKAITALKNQVKYLKNPPLPVEKVLENLKRCGLEKSAGALGAGLKTKN